MDKEVIQAWTVNGKLTELIAALHEVEAMASREGLETDSIASDIHLVSLVRATQQDGPSSLEVHFRA